MKIAEGVIRRFAEAEKICVLTGAGISAESGVPTFRGGGNSAVWKGMPFDQISSAQMVRENLDEVWEWFDYRRGVLADCKPNAAHVALAENENSFEEFTLVTQNVDGLHAIAGSKNMIELHGNINRAYCTTCENQFPISGVPHAPTTCKSCGVKLRPDVVLFGEMLPFGAFEKATAKATVCELFLVVGTSALVFPAAGLPEIAKLHGAFLVEINPEETPLSDLCDASLRGTACEIIPELFCRKAAAALKE